MKPIGPFDLSNQNQYFNGWPTLNSNKNVVVLCFPVEGWLESAAVTVSQLTSGDLDIQVYGAKNAEAAKQQALSALSLDEDGSGWAEVGRRDEFMGQLQQKYKLMRPSLFNSPYEAAANFIIGHRISMIQGRKIRSDMARDIGDKIDVKGEDFYAFPQPGKLLNLEAYKGLNANKIERLHAVARAALEGKLDRQYLRTIEEDAALKELEKIPGIGPFFSQGILYRGAGGKDGLTHDGMTYHAIKTAYNLSEDADSQEIVAVADRWRPYRMWSIVLLHVWLRETNNFPKRTFSKK